MESNKLKLSLSPQICVTVITVKNQKQSKDIRAKFAMLTWPADEITEVNGPNVCEQDAATKLKEGRRKKKDRDLAIPEKPTFHFFHPLCSFPPVCFHLSRGQTV